jgi:hypothetical protein
MTRIIDIVVPTDPQDVPVILLTLANRCDALTNAIEKRLARSDRTVALANFSAYVGGELRQISSFFPSNVPGLAWCARSMFEINLTVRFVLQSEENFRSWLGQALRDEKDFIEGVMAAGPQDVPASYEHLLRRLAFLDELAARHSIGYTRPFRMEQLAKSVGEHDEYVALYKLFSKYVHPSSLLINAWYRQKPNLEWVNIFLVKAQIYAGDTIGRLAAECGMESVVAEDVDIGQTKPPP